MELELRTTPVFTQNLEALEDPKIRFIVNQGSSRSSKTYSIMQLILYYCLMNKNKTVSIVRETLPELKRTVIREFFDLMMELGIYDEKSHNKTDNIYRFPNNVRLEFFSCDNSQKLRGAQRDILWIDESNAIDLEMFTQLNIRTKKKLIVSFNPSDSEHYLYDIAKQDNAKFIHSTYKDNTFLPIEQVKEIENLIKVDETYYQIYALGLPVVSKAIVYSHFKEYEEYEIEDITFDNILIGVDWGFNHPTAVTINRFKENQVYIEEILYESHLTVDQIISRIKEELKARDLMNSICVCDSARPEYISQFNTAGLTAIKAIKDVKPGIDAVKSMEVFVLKSSRNVWKEFKNYKWKTKNEKNLEEVVKLFDDALDSIRYACYYHKKNHSHGDGGSFDFSFAM